MTVRVELLSLNLWNLNEPLDERMERARAWVADETPDLLVLQEVSTLPNTGRTQAHELADAAGHDHVHFQRSWHGRNRDQGLAITSVDPLAPLDVVELPEVEGDELRILQQVEAETAAGPLRVANTHLAWRPDDMPGRIRQAAVLARELADCPVPVVLAGDLNDVHGSSPLLELEDTAGLRDVCRSDRPTFASENPWTWQVSLMDRRIDHVLVRDLQAASSEVVLTGQDAPPVSDHYGVRCVVEVT
ncbi:MAG: endonuclease/exonuclease/phosphatase family protein [Nitriliruptorales bacterium]|nr:endonuclease/exonuclease/phosphatase family protein [Nitriliruptorales bacterium]